MAGRTTLGRCLLILVAVGLGAQALASASHPSAAIAAAATTEGAGGEHDLGACDLCQLLSQERSEALPAPAGAGPPTALGDAVPSSRRALDLAGPSLAAAGPRAPPSFPIS